MIKHILVESSEATPGGPKISTKGQVNLPARYLIILNARSHKFMKNTNMMNLVCIPV